MTASLLNRALAGIVALWRMSGRKAGPPTDRWRDKRAQGALRSCGCFPWAFSPALQGADFGRNVRPLGKALISLAPSHITGGGDG